MKIYYNLDEEERMTNFRVAESVVNLCATEWGLDAEAIAKMILLQIDAEKGGEE
jgi:hypothetical protein